MRHKFKTLVFLLCVTFNYSIIYCGTKLIFVQLQLSILEYFNSNLNPFPKLSFKIQWKNNYVWRVVKFWITECQKNIFRKLDLANWKRKVIIITHHLSLSWQYSSCGISSSLRSLRWRVRIPILPLPRIKKKSLVWEGVIRLVSIVLEYNP